MVAFASAQQQQNSFVYSVNQHRSDAGIPSEYESTVNDQYSDEQSQHLLYNQQQLQLQRQQQQQQDQAIDNAAQYQANPAAYQQQQQQ